MDEVEDDLLCDSEPEDHVTLHKGLLQSGDQQQHSAKPIPIPSHKRRPVVKYEEGMYSVHQAQVKESHCYA